MATSKTAVDAISALMDQANRFEAMTVHLPKSPDFAAEQADEIVYWATKLITAVTDIKNQTQKENVIRQKQLDEKLLQLKAEAHTKKRKLTEANELRSSRTIRANFRLIFGPPRPPGYKSRAAAAAMKTSCHRIKIIRNLCEKYPDGVISLSASYTSKVWIEGNSSIFSGIIRQVKEEKEQAWPEAIIDIMDELEIERPMSDEFKSLRSMFDLYTSQHLTDPSAGKISQRLGRHRRQRTTDPTFQPPSLRQMGIVSSSRSSELVHTPPIQPIQTAAGPYPDSIKTDRRGAIPACQPHPEANASQTPARSSRNREDGWSPQPPSKENRGKTKSLIMPIILLTHA
ncbi:hypothetical protein LOZ58_006855 [Ophidiomyces ophidiicola]|nr:hypothetical protein LOZ58_006855 [Ophidiomyces ophidiicola]